MSEHGCESPLWVSVMSEVGTRSLRLLALLGTCLLLLAGIALGRFLAAVDTQETLDRMQAEIATLQTEVALSHQKSLQQESCLAQLQGRLELVRQAPLTRGWPVPTASAARLTQELQRTLTQRQCCLDELDSYTRRGRAIPSRHVVSFVDQLTAEHLGFVRAVAAEQEIPLGPAEDSADLPSLALPPLAAPSRQQPPLAAPRPLPAAPGTGRHAAASGACFAPSCNPGLGYLCVPKSAAPDAMSALRPQGLRFLDAESTANAEDQTRR